MGATNSTERLDHLTSLGFSVSEARLALDATGGNLEQAESLLRAKREREQASSSFGERVNLVLRQQRPWSEFVERFLWPEHLEERLATNLLYYQANYLVLCCGATRSKGRRLCEAVAGHRSLTRLHLGRLCEAVAGHCSLTRLHLKACGCSTDSGGEPRASYPTDRPSLCSQRDRPTCTVRCV